MKKMFAMLLSVLCFVSTCSAWKIVSDDGAATNLCGIVDTNGDYAARGMLGTNGVWSFKGILDTNGVSYSRGLIDRNGICWSSGICMNGLFYTNGVIYGSYPSLVRGSYGVLTAAGAFNSSGVLGVNGGNYVSRGVCSMSGSISTSGIVDSSGSMFSSGILNSTGIRYSGGILDSSLMYYSTGIFVSGSRFSTGVLDMGGTRYPTGILNSSGVAYSSGILSSSSSSYYYGIIGSGGVYKTNGTVNASNGTLYNSSYVVAPLGTLKASNIGTMRGTDDLVPAVLKAGATVDDVAGTMAPGVANVVVDGVPRAVESSAVLRVIQ